MPADQGNLLTEWARLLLASFADAGVRDVVISPGSRSTPFVVAAVRESRLRCHTIIDERAAAFFALGKARVDHIPALLLCTSGTAAAHYLPAIIEANATFVPLLVLTADRPSELSECAAPQTIDQVKLFGQNVRAFFELGNPDASELSLRALRRMAIQSVTTAHAPLPGAVHLNARARKPLEPVTTLANDLAEAARRIAAQPMRVSLPRVAPAENLEGVAAAIREAKSGILLCGPAPMSQARDREAIHAFARATRFPIAPEATSQLRFAASSATDYDGVHVLDTLEPLLKLGRVSPPDLVVQIGRPPTSTGWERLLPKVKTRIVLARYGWNDPDSSASHLVFGDLGANLRALAQDRRDGAMSPWAESLIVANEKARSLLPDDEELLSEGQVARTVVQSAPRGSCLMLGNSLAVRLVDTFAPHASNELLGVLSQRGASGIDGLVAGAAGSASVSSTPITLLLGDVSLLHDLTSLAIAKESSHIVPIVIVVVQNNGGRIFEQLPLATAPDIEQEILDRTITPHTFDFRAAATMFDISYARIDTRIGDLRDALRKSYDRGHGCTLIEVVVPPHGARIEQQKLAERIAAAIEVETACR